MNINEDKIDESALALLYLTLHEQSRAWKQINWDVMNRFYEKGMILDPVNKSKSVVLTNEGLKKSEELFNSLFVKSYANFENLKYQFVCAESLGASTL